MTKVVDEFTEHRVILNDLFLFAIHAGYTESNPVTPTMTKTAPKQKRKKHTVEGWNKIRAAAPEWLQRAMDIALLTLKQAPLKPYKIKPATMITQCLSK